MKISICGHPSDCPNCGTTKKNNPVIAIESEDMFIDTYMCKNCWAKVFKGIMGALLAHNN